VHIVPSVVAESVKVSCTAADEVELDGVPPPPPPLPTVTVNVTVGGGGPPVPPSSKAVDPAAAAVKTTVSLLRIVATPLVYLVGALP